MLGLFDLLHACQDHLVDELVHQLEVGRRFTGILCDVLPEADGQLGRKECKVLSHVFTLLGIERVLAKPLDELVVDRADLVDRGLFHPILDAVVIIQDLFGRDESLDRLQVCHEPCSCGESDESRRELMQEVLVRGRLQVQLIEPVFGVGDGEVFPASAVGVFLHVRCRLAGIEHRVVHEKKVDDVRVNVATVFGRITRPLEPLLERGSELAHPPAREECRVEVGHLVARRIIVHSHENTALRMHHVAVELMVQSDLERCLDDLAGCTIALVEEQKAGFVTGAKEPVCGPEARCDSFEPIDLDVHLERKTDDVTFGHLRETPVDDRELVGFPIHLGTNEFCCVAHEFALADAVPTHDEDTFMRRKHLHALQERCDVHLCDVSSGRPFATL